MTSEPNLPAFDYYCKETEPARKETEPKHSLHDPPSFSKLHTVFMESDIGSEQTQVQNYPINLYGFASESEAATRELNEEAKHSWHDLIKENPFTVNSHAREQHQASGVKFEMTDPTRLVSLGPNQQNEFFAGADIASPPVEIEAVDQNTVSHESADVMEQVSLSELVEAQNKKYAQKNERRPSKRAKTSLRSLLQPPTRQQNLNASSASEAENENHSCEDEELVMKDENESHNKPNGEIDLYQKSKRE